MNNKLGLNKESQAMFDYLVSKGIKPSAKTMLILRANSGDLDCALEFLERYSEGWRNREKYPIDEED